MKLLYCKKCEDVIRLTFDLRVCSCGRTGGKYIDKRDAVYFGNNAVPLSIGWTTFLDAVNNPPEVDSFFGKTFTAFVIPKECPTMKRVVRRSLYVSPEQDKINKENECKLEELFPWLREDKK